MAFPSQFFIFNPQMDNPLLPCHPQCAQHTDDLKTKSLKIFSLFLVQSGWRFLSFVQDGAMAVTSNILYC